MTGPRYAYLHGFASSPASKKAVVFGEHFQKRGEDLVCPDLRVPALETLRVSAMIDVARAVVGGDPRERAVLIGSSLGALTAARAAEREPRICALVLLAPAFGMARRWRARLGDDAVARWRDTGWLPLTDPEGPLRLHYEFLLDADAVDGGDPPDVRVPTLVIHGRQDDVVPIESSRAWAQGKNHVQLVEVDDGHALYGSLDRVCAEIDRFVFHTST